MHIQVSETQELRNVQCINCFKCIGSCPVGGTLSYGKAEKAVQRIRDKIRPHR